jgi:hypothetical protein
VRGSASKSVWLDEDALRTRADKSSRCSTAREAAEFQHPANLRKYRTISTGGPHAAAVFRRLATTVPMGGAHCDPIGRHQLLIEGVTIVPAVAAQPHREVREAAGVEPGGKEVRLMRRSAGHVDGDR